MSAVFFLLLCYTKPSFILFSSVLIRVTVRELLGIFVLLTKCSPRCSWTYHKILDESRKPSGYPAKLRDIRLIRLAWCCAGGLYWWCRLLCSWRRLTQQRLFQQTRSGKTVRGVLSKILHGKPYRVRRTCSTFWLPTFTSRRRLFCVHISFCSGTFRFKNKV